MSDFYRPDDDALPKTPWLTTLLSQRDISLQVPLPFVTVPGVSLRAACFPNGRYESDDALKCFSNLLAAGFRRFVIDVYWDVGREEWSLCPAAIPSGPARTTAAPSRTSTSVAPLSSAQFSSGDFEEIVEGGSRGTGNAALLPRQASTTTEPPSAGSSTPTSTATSSNASSSNGTLTSTSPARVSATAAPPSQVSGLYQIGPYTCSSDINLVLLMNVVNQYLDRTETTTAATFNRFLINLHVAAAWTSPEDPARAPEDNDLPQPGNLISDVVAANLSAYLYTPGLLAEERKDIQTSWLSLNNATEPSADYFDTIADSDGVLTSTSGWPSESYVELTRAKRLMIGFGTIDPQMEGYNYTGDSPLIFPAGDTAEPRLVDTASDGDVTRGCFFSTSETDLSSVNSSWAVSDSLLLPENERSSLNDTLISARNLTMCGISPILNGTLFNISASTNIIAYRQLAHSTIWSWAYEQPKNSSAAPEGVDSDVFRCAAFDRMSTSGWFVADCSDRHRAACRHRDQPYVWRLSEEKGTYTEVDNNCPDDHIFAVPRTALESTYLYAAARNATYGNEDDDRPVWLNFNSLDIDGCWVSGINSTCPYSTMDQDAERRRTVIVPTVAAVIIFVLAALTVFIKCAANRRNSRRRRRRGDEGWDYEGVPS